MSFFVCACFIPFIAFAGHRHNNATHKNDHQYKQIDCLAEVIYFESRNQPISVQFRVGQVVLNRVDDNGGLFPNSICEVVNQRRFHKRCQFSWKCHYYSIKNEKAWDRAKSIATSLYMLYYVFPIMPDLTNNALYFVKYGTRLSWMKEMVKDKQGDIVFLASNDAE